MARIPYLDQGTAGPGATELLGTLPPMHVFGAMTHADGLFASWVRLSGAVLNDVTLAPLHRELAIVRVAALSPGASYEREQHEEIARQLGMSDAQVEGARTGAGQEGDDALIVRVTEEVVRDVAPADAAYARFAERFDARQLVELLVVIGQYMMVARVIATLRIDPDPPIGSSLLGALA